MKRPLLIALLASVGTITFSAPPKKVDDYSSWNDKWFVSCQGESFIVAVKVGNPKSAGSHSFRADFLLGGGVCSVGADAPVTRASFLSGTLSNGKISGTIYLCTTSQELVDKNNLSAVFSRKFQASYSPRDANITDAIYKSEHYKRYDEDTHHGQHSEASAPPGPYQRDEPGDVEAGFEMHLYRGPAYDQVTPPYSNPGPTPVPLSPAGKAQQDLQDIVHKRTSHRMNHLSAIVAADPTH